MCVGGGGGAAAERRRKRRRKRERESREREKNGKKRVKKMFSFFQKRESADEKGISALTLLLQ